ncbi:transcriptional regulator [Opitutaceae bacterium TAV1]|nr:TetR family transcriptional regulator [Opitutaceae bacterium TAV5]EIP99604.1 transcriptional regulator [Opitutaceae bacterium TAV1]
MRYEKDHKEKSHRRVVEAAAARFRKEGLDSVGVVTLMNDAGLTHGAFYSHFPSKEALVGEAIGASMDELFRRSVEKTKEGGIEGLISRYLRAEHRAHPEKGCPVAALGAEIGRRARPTRAIYTRKLKRMLAHIESLLPDPKPETAQAIFALLVGSLQLARTVTDPALSDRILESGKTAALALAQR